MRPEVLSIENLTNLAQCRSNAVREKLATLNLETVTQYFDVNARNAAGFTLLQVLMLAIIKQTKIYNGDPYSTVVVFDRQSMPDSVLPLLDSVKQLIKLNADVNTLPKPLLHLTMQSKNNEILDAIIAACGDKLDYLQKDQDNLYAFDFSCWAIREEKHSQEFYGSKILVKQLIKKNLTFPWRDYYDRGELPAGVSTVLCELEIQRERAGDVVKYIKEVYGAAKLLEKSRDSNSAFLYIDKRSVSSVNYFLKVSTHLFSRKDYLDDPEMFEIVCDLLNRGDVGVNFSPTIFSDFLKLDHGAIWLKLAQNENEITDLPEDYIKKLSAYVYAFIAKNFPKNSTADRDKIVSFFKTIDEAIVKRYADKLLPALMRHILECHSDPKRSADKSLCIDLVVELSKAYPFVEIFPALFLAGKQQDDRVIEIARELLSKGVDTTNFSPDFSMYVKLDHGLAWKSIAEKKKEVAGFPSDCINPFSAYVYAFFAEHDPQDHTDDRKRLVDFLKEKNKGIVNRYADQFFPMLMLRILECHYDPNKKAAKSRDILLLTELSSARSLFQAEDGIVVAFAKLMLEYCYAMYIVAPKRSTLARKFSLSDNAAWMKSISLETEPFKGLFGLLAYASYEEDESLYYLYEKYCEKAKYLALTFQAEAQESFVLLYGKIYVTLFNYLVYSAIEKLPHLKNDDGFKNPGEDYIDGNVALANVMQDNIFLKREKAAKEKAALQQQLQVLSPNYVPPKPSAPEATVPPTRVPSPDQSLAGSPTHSRHASVANSGITNVPLPLYPDLKNNTTSTTTILTEEASTESTVNNNVEDSVENVFYDGSKNIPISDSNLSALRAAIPVVKGDQNSNYFGSLAGVAHQPTLSEVNAARKTTPEKSDSSDDQIKESPEKLVTPVDAEPTSQSLTVPVTTVVVEFVNDQTENSASLTDRVSLYGGLSKTVKSKSSIKTSTQTIVLDEKISVLRKKIISDCETGTIDDIESKVKQLRAIEDELNSNTNVVDKIARLNDKIKDLVVQIKVDCESVDCDGIFAKSQQLKLLKKELTSWESLSQVLSADISSTSSYHETQGAVLDKKRRNSFSL